MPALGQHIFFVNVRIIFITEADGGSMVPAVRLLLFVMCVDLEIRRGLLTRRGAMAAR